MYLNYMERWQNKFLQQGLELVFVSVEYRMFPQSIYVVSHLPASLSRIAALTDVASHPAQLHAFLDTYKHVLGQGVPPSQIIFMGDSAGGLCSDNVYL
jgi:acetyl esterase/lipase